jgi:hypothetical protein
LDAFIAYEKPTPEERALMPRAARAPRDAHDWQPSKAKPAELRGTCPSAETTLTKRGVAFLRCTHCGALKNSAYPYWFRSAETRNWLRTKPTCITSTGQSES